MTQELLTIQQSQGQVKYDKERVQAALKAEEARLDALVEADAVLTDLEQLRERAVKTKVSGAADASGLWAWKVMCETDDRVAHLLALYPPCLQGAARWQGQRHWRRLSSAGPLMRLIYPSGAAGAGQQPGSASSYSPEPPVAWRLRAVLDYKGPHPCCVAC